MFKKLIHHFSFRITQGLRVFNLNPRFGFAFLALVIAFIFVKIPNPFYPVLVLFIVWGFHWKRKDIPFLQKVFVNSWRFIIIAEALAIYAFLGSINKNYHWEQTGFAIGASLFLLGFIYPRKSVKFTFSWNSIPSELFEWKSFFRKYSLGAIFAYLAFIACAYHPFTMLFSTLFLLEIIGSIFEKNENKEMYVAYFQTQKLNVKIKKNLNILNVLLIPILAVYSILNYQSPQYILIYLVFVNLYTVLIISNKYKNYHHKSKETTLNMADELLFTLSTFTVIPALVMIRKNLKTAESKIKSYVGN